MKPHLRAHLNFRPASVLSTALLTQVPLTLLASTLLVRSSDNRDNLPDTCQTISIQTTSSQRHIFNTFEKLQMTLDS